MSDTELAWAAGFFDGEGNVRSNDRLFVAKRQYYQPVIQISQTSREPLERFKSAVGVGCVSGPFIRKSPKHQPVFRYFCGSFDGVQLIFGKLYPYLCSIKRKQFEAVVERIKQHLSRPRGQKGIPTNG